MAVARQLPEACAPGSSDRLSKAIAKTVRQPCGHDTSRVAATAISGEGVCNASGKPISAARPNHDKLVPAIS
ncbi:hypothetical protein OG963_43955 (plasmid) [Streptomyces sp. NBC_01707]|uniref:hypothetical protein n=1 Tax=Streptomyces sp. NBC_01707 TaxID=2975914 RepID=UPI00352F1DD4